MKKSYSAQDLIQISNRNEITKELTGKTWEMKIQGTQNNGYILEHPSFSGTVFGEFGKISSKKRLQRDGYVKVEICVVKKANYKFRVKQGEEIIPPTEYISMDLEQEKKVPVLNTLFLKKNVSIKGKSQCIRVFIDESGDFSSTGNHLIASLCHIDERSYHSLLKHVEDCFEKTGNSYRNVHATGMGTEKKESVFTYFAKELAEKKVSIYMNSVQLHKKAKFDTYFPLLIRSILEAINHLSAIYDKINLEIYLEDRVSSNYKILCDIIREQCLKKKIIVPTLRVLNLPKGENALLSLTDLFSNIYFSDLNHGTNLFQTELKNWDRQYYKQPDSLVSSKKAKEIAQRITIGKIIKITRPTKIITKVVNKVVNKPGKTVFVHDDTTVSERLINEFNLRFRQVRFAENKNRIFNEAHNKLSKYSPLDRLYEIEKLLDVYQDLYENREFHTSIIFSEFITFHLEKEFSLKTADIQKLKWLYIRNTSQWLTAQNHLGEYKPQHQTVIKAEKFIKEFVEYSDCWSEVAGFFNHIAIACQNIFEFEAAAERLLPYVEYFSKLTHNPFGTNNITGRYIGGLFGSYSQSLFFYSHCSYYYSRGGQFEENFDEAIVYSELSEIFFDDNLDIQRQHIYRAHGYMQRFILLGDETALDKAETQLSLKFDLTVLNKTFFEDPRSVPSNNLYAFVALLKLAWLRTKSKNKVKFNLELPKSKRLIKIIDAFPAKHPYEQILGYLILLKDNENITSEVIKQKKWAENIVKIIALTFSLQIHWEKNKLIEKDIMDQLEILISDRLMEPWTRYGIIKQIGEMEGSLFEGIGPLMVLPFNYA